MGFSKTVDTTFLTVVVVGSIAFGDATNNESTTRQKKKKKNLAVGVYQSCVAAMVISKLIIQTIIS